jgi:hypothetical protein
VGEALQLFISILNSGVSIVTREPRRTYTQDSINDIAALLEPLIYMNRAHKESATKSFRLKVALAKKKERAAQGYPMTRMAPRWLELTEQGYRPIPDRAETVRTIFRLSAEGIGVQRILQYLVAHPKKHPPFGDSGRWRDSNILQILGNKAAYGEFQPGMRDEAGRKVACGDPITNYFPAVISEDLFYQVQAGMKARFHVLGRPGGIRDETLYGDRLPRRGPHQDVGPHIPPGHDARRRDAALPISHFRGHRQRLAAAWQGTFVPLSAVRAGRASGTLRADAGGRAGGRRGR